LRNSRARCRRWNSLITLPLLGRVARLRLQRPPYDALHLLVGDRTRRTRAGLIEQAIQPVLDEPRAPAHDGLARHALDPGDMIVGAAFGTRQDHPRSLTQDTSLPQLPGADPPTQPLSTLSEIPSALGQPAVQGLDNDDILHLHLP
jgi:hypothetical protein